MVVVNLVMPGNEIVLNWSAKTSGGNVLSADGIGHESIPIYSTEAGTRGHIREHSERTRPSASVAADNP